MPKASVFYAVVGVSIAVLAWGLLPGHAYGYFQALRVVVCFAAAYLAVLAHRASSEALMWLLGLTAALYNPFLPVHLTRDIWWVVNVATIVLLVIVAASLRRPRQGGSEAPHR